METLYEVVTYGKQLDRDCIRQGTKTITGRDERNQKVGKQGQKSSCMHHFEFACQHDFACECYNTIKKMSQARKFPREDERVTECDGTC